jgi:hypothetical protein
MKHNKVYVPSIPQGVAGGIEAQYQLVDALQNLGVNAQILYVHESSTPVPDKYYKYNTRGVFGYEAVEDSPDNLIIYPEVLFSDPSWEFRFNRCKNIKNAIWWLSVDNNQNTFNDWNNPDITHFYQSYYAMDFLAKNGAQQYFPLFDYLNDSFFEYKVNLSKKENIICYNPAKGVEITQHIMQTNPDLSFIPLVNMTEKQVIDTLKRSKIYIDFGNHPGKDRIPREAALLKNCVITNKTGSAKYCSDVPINSKYKFSKADNLRETFLDCFENFQDNLSNFSLYRNNIRYQKAEFTSQVAQFFSHDL